MFCLEGVPGKAVKVIVTSEQETTRGRESDTSDTAEDVVVAVSSELSVSADIKETAGGVIRASGKGEAVGEESDRVDIRLVSLEGLDALARADIPVLGESITSTRNKGVLVRSDRDGHDITVVISELSDLLTSLNVPEDARHITRGSEDLAVAQETAAGNVASVCVQLAARLDGDLSRPEVVDAAGVVETTASDKASVGAVAAGHNPGAAERDNVDLVGCETIPHKKLAVLRSRNEMV